jgi:hypothetical protein
VAFISMGVTNLLGIPLHGLYEEAQRSMLEKDQTKAIPKIRLFMAVLLFLSWDAFYASWYVYLTEVGTFFEEMPEAIQFLVVVLPIFFLSFGIV